MVIMVSFKLAYTIKTLVSKPQKQHKNKEAEADGSLVSLRPNWSILHSEFQDNQTYSEILPQNKQIKKLF